MPESGVAAEPPALDAEEILNLVLRDFDVPVVRSVEVRVAVADPQAPLNVSLLPDPGDWFVDGEKPILLQLGRNVTDVSADASEEVKAAIASRLQDFVVDETGRPWPEVSIDGSIRVLDVTLDDDGAAVWAYSGKAMCRVGCLEQRQV